MRGTSRPFSAMNIRTMCGLGPPELYNFIVFLPLGASAINRSACGQSSAPGLDQYLGVPLRIAELLESGLHALEPDLGSDQRLGVDRAVGQQFQRMGELLRRVGPHKLHTEFLQDAEQGLHAVEFHSQAPHGYTRSALRSLQHTLS